MDQKKVITARIDLKNCTGCSACIAACPKKCLQISADRYGFYIPEMADADACIDCGLCTAACPVLRVPDVSVQKTSAYAAISNNRMLRMESSSGGIFSELALKVFAEGGFVYGAVYNEEFRVVHQCTDNRGDLAAFRGAKYAQSDIGGCFGEIESRLRRSQLVLFSGTPCQTAGLKTFLGKEYENLITVDFVCHGVPSPKAWGKYVNYRAEIDNDGVLPEAINLRSKKTGWSRYRYSNRYIYQGDKEYLSESGKDLFMRLFTGDYINRESCAGCRFKGYDRVSDITLADFWGIWDVAPEMDDDKGTSLVLLHSGKAKDLFSGLEKDGKIKLKEVGLPEASKQNPSLLYSSASRPERGAVLDYIMQNGYFGAEKFFPSAEPAKRGSVQRIKQRFFRMIK